MMIINIILILLQLNESVTTMSVTIEQFSNQEKRNKKKFEKLSDEVQLFKQKAEQLHAQLEALKQQLATMTTQNNELSMYKYVTLFSFMIS